LIQVKALQSDRRHSASDKKEIVMPFESILYVTFVLSALALFASTLAYADWATRHANDPVRMPAHFAEDKPCCHDNDAGPVRKAA
jgi:hypothetical protein